nr:nucleoside/nucleotide kinase family protein [Rhodoferax sp. PAMC 29310]
MVVLPETCRSLLAQWASASERVILGLVAPPGAGKSTLAQAVHAAFPLQSQIVPMDGFHLANVELARLGRSGRKGAADTFDASGFLSLLHRIRSQAPGEMIYAPDFRRDLEEGVAGAIPVFAETPLIIVEGNYLLLDEGPWAEVRGVLNEVWYLDVEEPLRRDRLLHRHMRYGRTREEALAWMTSTDDPNASLIEASRHRATRQITWGGQA